MIRKIILFVVTELNDLITEFSTLCCFNCRLNPIGELLDCKTK